MRTKVSTSPDTTKIIQPVSVALPEATKPKEQYEVNPSVHPLAQTLSEALAEHNNWVGSDGSSGQEFDFHKWTLVGADLTGADFSSAKLAGANLRDAQLKG